ncbi:MAG: MoxR family ATPase [Deltaproteobacteria bacterium]|nr:MoxR family ATPase [Deltaproteobacteria bacterium]
MNAEIEALHQRIQQESAFVESVLQETQKVIVGQKVMVERVLIGLLTGGHILLEGVPGLAKTLTVNTIARTLHCTFKRIQFTPDLLPADLVGTQIWDPETRRFSPKQGPVFANVVLADEVNRAPAKVQSALLEAMQERQVTLGDSTFKLPDPFLVLATQNPIEQEGTYPLPEAQVDRFMMLVKVGYPTRDEERAIMDRMTAGHPAEAGPVVTLEQVQRAREVVRDVYMDDRIKNYIVNLIIATREPENVGLRELKPLIAFGASPRASIALNLAARAHAFLRHRGFVIPEDIKAVGLDVLRHRVLLTFEAEAEEINSDNIIRKVFERVEVP